jgi:putative FmdB family regulatory protein
MVYEYSCAACNKTWDVIKPVSEYQSIELCLDCGKVGVRAFAPKKIHLHGTSVQDAYFNVGLGKIVKNDAHARQIAKDKGFIEVGNERPEKHLSVKLSDYED